MLFPFLTCFIIFILWMTIKIKMSDRKMTQNTKLFWETERKANATRKQPLDSIAYITIPIDRLPLLEHPTATLAPYQEKILSLSTQKIANLSGQSNTELKLSYGAGNLEILSLYDQNCTELLRTLFQWGQELIKEELYPEAKTVLEFGVVCKTDISKHYTLLAEIYKMENRPDKISDLISQAEQLNCLMKPSIIRSLNEIFESCQTHE